MPGVLGVGHTVEEENGAVEDGDGCQVWGAGGEGFAATAGWMHLEDGDKNKYVGHENDEKCADLIKGGENKKQQLVDISIRAREGEQWGELTEEVVDCVGSLEG